MDERVLRFVTEEGRRAAEELPEPRAAQGIRLPALPPVGHIIRHHSKTFSLAARCLPPRTRQAVEAFYAFCRSADDFADEIGVDGAHGAERLQAYLSAIRGQAPAPDQILGGWLAVSDALAIPRRWSEVLVRALLDDVRRSILPTFEDLLAYAYGVASTVGLVTTVMLGDRRTRPRADTFARAIALGIGMQLTNILRDVAEDLARGRVYLPVEDLQRFGVTAQHLADGHLHEGWQRLLRHYIALARDLYDYALPGVSHLAPAGRLPVALAAVWYRAILRDIERHGGDVFTRRAHVPLAEKLWLACAQGLPAAFGWGFGSKARATDPSNPTPHSRQGGAP
ncbi:phytoene/squalene synthase family protein [Alicyclobacillus sendaiensis]|uniref:phytoene/squalene synthase family protein n=1 Tax=Alicyclobacillus sendaiensis TaxID=192387 RepID=UPI0026F468C6|nr:phytoene/squalene synthase family protein [Alicyclobacillus sendaiensis]